MTGFPDKAVMAELTAKMLLEVDAVRFMTDKPFIYTSGWASPVYTDCRRLISFPRVRSTLVDFGVATVLRDAGFEQFDAVAGGETAGNPFAAWMADRLMLPMQYVRKKPKGFGRNAQIEGHIKDGERVLLARPGAGRQVDQPGSRRPPWPGWPGSPAPFPTVTCGCSPPRTATPAGTPTPSRSRSTAWRSSRPWSCSPTAAPDAGPAGCPGPP